MNNFINHIIDQIEAYIGAWIMANRAEAIGLFLLFVIVGWAFFMNHHDYRNY